MKTLIADIFPKIQRFSNKLDNQTLLTNKHWVSIDTLLNQKTVFIFRSKDELLISTDGRVEKGNWEYLGNNSLLINKSDESYLFKHGFLDDNVLALRVDSKDEYAVFVNENRYDGDLNSLEKVTKFLENKYFETTRKSSTSNLNQKNRVTTENKRGITEEEYEANKSNPLAQVIIAIVVAILVIVVSIMTS